MYRLRLFAVVSVLLGWCAVGCMEAYARVAESESMRNFELQGAVQGMRPMLTVSGKCGRSGDVVEGVQVIKKGRSRQLLVYLSALDRDSRPQEFSETIDLTDVDEVTFGHRREVLWKRPVKR